MIHLQHAGFDALFTEAWSGLLFARRFIYRCLNIDMFKGKQAHLFSGDLFGLIAKLRFLD